MQTMTNEAMQRIEGGIDWADFACGVTAAVAIGGATMISAGTFGLAAPLTFAIGYSLAAPACGVAAFT